MIVTVTANPSLDRTAGLGGPLVRGGVNRILSVGVQAGGKGVNVARVVAMGGGEALALLPARADDPLVAALGELAVPFRTVPVPGLARTNLTVAEPDGTTTKINEPGAAMTEADLTALGSLVLDAARSADWVALSGSLPPGVPEDWYAHMVRQLHAHGCRVAVDTSDAPLRALAARMPDAAPDLLKPNSEELAQLTGADAETLEATAAAGDLRPSVEAARALVGRGVGAVLATLGAAGALLVTGEGAWAATPPPVTPRSTVGAGDSALAGYLLATTSGGQPPDCLRQAVAYGSAAASLPGTTLPQPDQTDPNAVRVRAAA
ncbi:1-phosphofructokinase [Georgenia sp. AZ-5]|uniref:1-phosphofructokinase n=1 Tax=Georgenia sp. AZ-5 TaxID=3367526 RepID=UPI00375507D8